MKEKTILKIAFFTSVLGIILLFIISDKITLDETRLNESHKLVQDYTIKITGKIIKINANENITRIKLEQINTITAVYFDEINISDDKEVEIIGKVDEYKGNKQIIVEEMKIIGGK